MNKKEYLNPITKVFVLESRCPVCQASPDQSSGALSSFEVDDYTPDWDD